MWTVMVRNYPMEKDVCWEDDFPYFENQKDANKCAEELQRIWSEPSAAGHQYYKAKFYAMEISNDYIEAKQHSWAMEMASRM